MRLTSFSVLFWITGGIIILAVAFPTFLQSFVRISTSLYERYGGSPSEIDRTQYPAREGKPEGWIGAWNPEDFPPNLVLIEKLEKTARLKGEEREFRPLLYARERDGLEFQILLQFENPTLRLQRLELGDEIINGSLSRVLPSYEYLSGDRPAIIIPPTWPKDPIVIQLFAQAQGALRFRLEGQVSGQVGEKLINKAILTQPGQPYRLDDEVIVLIKD